MNADNNRSKYCGYPMVTRMWQHVDEDVDITTGVRITFGSYMLSSLGHCSTMAGIVGCCTHSNSNSSVRDANIPLHCIDICDLSLNFQKQNIERWNMYRTTQQSPI